MTLGKRVLKALVVLLCFAGCGDCRKGDTQAETTTSDTHRSELAEGDSSSAKKKPTVKRGGKRKVTVFLDGEPIAALRYGELPPGLGEVTVEYGIMRPAGQKRSTRRCFRLADYLESLGFEIKELKTILLTAGRASRMSHIDPKELLKHREDMFFAFTGDTSGGVYMRYSPSIKTNDVIDKLLKIYLYKDKPAPVWNAKKRDYFFKGKRMETIPYVEGGFKKGTRLYLSNRVVGYLNRRTLKKGIGHDGDGGGGGGGHKAQGKGGAKPAFSTLAEVLQKGELPSGKVLRADLVVNERVVRMVKPEDFEKLRLEARPGGGGGVYADGFDEQLQAVLLHTEIVKKPKTQFFSTPEP